MDEPAATFLGGRGERARMGGRKQRDLTEAEKTWEYRQAQRRGRGDHVVGERGERLDDRGAAAEVREERREWLREQDEKGPATPPNSDKE